MKFGLNDIITIGNNKTAILLHNYNQQEFVNKTGTSAKVYDDYKHSKLGYMTLKKISDNPGYLNSGQTETGWCFAFGEGLSCRIDDCNHYFYTSVVESIDWNNKTFKTKNSTYAFTLEECTPEELLNASTNQEEFIDSYLEEG